MIEHATVMETQHDGGRSGTATRQALKIVLHVCVLAVLYLAFTFSLLLGLHVGPRHGNVGVMITVVLAGLYVRVGLIRSHRRRR